MAQSEDTTATGADALCEEVTGRQSAAVLTPMSQEDHRDKERRGSHCHYTVCFLITQSLQQTRRAPQAGSAVSPAEAARTPVEHCSALQEDRFQSF